MASSIPPLDPAQLITPLLPALVPAAVSTEAAPGVLPLLSPILRQRVKIFSATSTDPWLRLLCYDTAKAAKLAEVTQKGGLEPHPVSGEVEIDWDYDAQIRYRRVDPETLQAFVVLPGHELAFQLVYCVNDQEGGGDGWRIGEVTIPDQSSPFAQFGGAPDIAEAERQSEQGQPRKDTPKLNSNSQQNLDVPHSSNDVHNGVKAEADEEDNDDDYWARYDATPARTPAQKSPAPPKATSKVGDSRSHSAEDSYYAQYDDVQPAMDNHDPDEEEAARHLQVDPPLGLSHVTSSGSGEAAEVNETQGAWTMAELDKSEQNPTRNLNGTDNLSALVHPRPASSASSNGSDTVAKLEATAGQREQSEFGVKKHVSRSIRSLYMLSRASGIDREEFERIVHTELDVLSMVEHDE